MRKNGSRLISIQQYRLTDLTIFAIILLLGELLPFMAAKWFPHEAMFALSFTVPISLIVLVRWGWPSIIFAALGGVLCCALNGAAPLQYLIYGVGNTFIGLELLIFLGLKKRTVTGRWYNTLWFSVLGWGLAYLGKSVMWAIAFAVSPVEGATAASGFVQFIAYDFLSFIMCPIVMLALRRFDGLVEDQKAYLLRLKEEREEKMRRDEFGDEPIEIDAETINILNRGDDLYD